MKQKSYQRGFRRNNSRVLKLINEMIDMFDIHPRGSRPGKPGTQLKERERKKWHEKVRNTLLKSLMNSTQGRRDCASSEHSNLQTFQACKDNSHHYHNKYHKRCHVFFLVFIIDTTVRCSLSHPIRIPSIPSHPSTLIAYGVTPILDVL